MAKNRACLFAHFDKDGKVDSYVYEYVKSLLPFANKFIFISTSLEPNSEDCKKLKDLGVDVICRENIGYDFFSWKSGFSELNLDQYDEILQVNDSCYAPLFDFSKVFKKMDQSQCDFWGLTISYQYKTHVQSFFVCYRKKVIDSVEFQNFWKNLEIIPDKMKLIKNYEIGLSQKLLENGFVARAYFEPSFKNYIKKLFVYYFFRFFAFLKRAIYFPVKMVMNIWYSLLKTSGKKVDTVEVALEETYYVHWSALVIRFLRLLRVFVMPWKVYFWFKNLIIVNPSHFLFEEMLEQGTPIFKVELVRDNPIKVFEKNLREIPGINQKTLDNMYFHQKRVSKISKAKNWVTEPKELP